MMLNFHSRKTSTDRKFSENIIVLRVENFQLQIFFRRKICVGQSHFTKIFLSRNGLLDCIDSLTLQNNTLKMADIGPKASNITVYLFSFQVLETTLAPTPRRLQDSTPHRVPVLLTPGALVGRPTTSVISVRRQRVPATVGDMVEPRRTPWATLASLGFQLLQQEVEHLPIKLGGLGTKPYLCIILGGCLLELSRLHLLEHTIRRPTFMDKTPKLA